MSQTDQNPCPEKLVSPQHPKRSQARVLLTSVFGPYACDDEHGSRRINPMELYHNQVTRVQGAFSLRMFHRTWGLQLIQANIEAPCAVLDFPTLERFVQELKARPYDVIGISSIAANIGKVRKMCELIRLHRPEATIVVGGHVAAKPNLDQLIDADHIVRGEGVRWWRNYLGEDPNRPIRHPFMVSGSGSRVLGMRLDDAPEKTAATLIPSVGCPMGCNFCSTSALFGGKGNFVSFYETGDELFEVMCQIEEEMHVQSFFVMDENFLFHRQRALRLLELMREHGKAWSLYVFSSANVLRSYSMDQLLGLGVSWVWIGLEGQKSAYNKLKGSDTFELVRWLQDNGIRVLGSSIIGLEDHRPETIDAVIDHAVRHDTDFHQFMLYTPVPGTPLHAKHVQDGTLLSDEECPDADAHGQHRFKHRHPNFQNGEETEILLRAFRRDFDVNGPSLVRLARTMLRGWQRHKNHPDPRVRVRMRRECSELASTWAGLMWAAERWFRRRNPDVARRIAAVQKTLWQEFGARARINARLIGPVILFGIWREQRRLEAGWTRDPPTFFQEGPVRAAECPRRASAVERAA